MEQYLDEDKKKIAVRVAAISAGAYIFTRVVGSRAKTREQRSKPVEPYKGTYTRPPKNSQNISVGDEVWYTFISGGKSKDFKGKVVGVNEKGNLEILFDDGDRRKHCDPLCCKVIAKKSAESKKTDVASVVASDSKEVVVGSKVMYEFAGGKKFAGTVKAVNSDTSVEILFDDGERRKDCHISKLTLVPKVESILAVTTTTTTTSTASSVVL